MKMIKILMTIGVLICGIKASAQIESTTNSKWEETKDGVTYSMTANMKGVATKNVEKPHITLHFKGNLDQLSKVIFSKKAEVNKLIPVMKGGQNIDVEPGHYLFQFYHKKIGLREFEIDLKRNDYNQMTVTL